MSFNFGLKHAQLGDEILLRVLSIIALNVNIAFNVDKTFNVNKALYANMAIFPFPKMNNTTSKTSPMIKCKSCFQCFGATVTRLPSGKVSAHILFSGNKLITKRDVLFICRSYPSY